MQVYDGMLFHTAMTLFDHPTGGERRTAGVQGLGVTPLLGSVSGTISGSGSASGSGSVSGLVTMEEPVSEPVDDLTEQFKSCDLYGTLLSEAEKKKLSLLDIVRQDRSAANIAKEIQNAKQPLPIDEFKYEILEAVDKERVVIIHGETGCGKSSRLPAILLDDAESRNHICRMMVRNLLFSQALSIHTRHRMRFY